MTQKLSRLKIYELREMAASLGADKKTLYGTSKTALIIRIHQLQDEARREATLER